MLSRLLIWSLLLDKDTVTRRPVHSIQVKAYMSRRVHLEVFVDHWALM